MQLNVLTDLFMELLKVVLSKWGAGMTLAIITIAWLLIRYLESAEKRVKLVEERSDKEIDRLVKERDKLQDHLLKNRISSERGTNVETSDD